MFDLNKLSPQIDLQNLDLAQIIRIISEHINNLVKFVLIGGTLLIAVVIFNDYHAKDQVLRVKMSQVQQKFDAIKAREAAIQGLSGFKSSLPKKLNEFELITLISKYAKLYHIIIPSLSPAESKDMGLYDVINVSFEAEANSFKDMIVFLGKIEKSNLSLRIDSWSGRKTESGIIDFQMGISAVLIHT